MISSSASPDHVSLAVQVPQAGTIGPTMADAAHKGRNVLSFRLFLTTNMTGYAAHKITMHKELN